MSVKRSEEFYFAKPQFNSCVCNILSGRRLTGNQECSVFRVLLEVLSLSVLSSFLTVRDFYRLSIDINWKLAYLIIIIWLWQSFPIPWQIHHCPFMKHSVADPGFGQGRPQNFFSIFYRSSKAKLGKQSEQRSRALETLAFLTIKYAFSHFSWYFLFKFSAYIYVGTLQNIFQYKKFCPFLQM